MPKTHYGSFNITKNLDVRDTISKSSKIYQPVIEGTAAPTATPDGVGQIFVDTTTNKAYTAIETSGVPATDWQQQVLSGVWDVDQTHHIYVSPDGDDTTGDGSPQMPLQTLKNGVDNHKASSGLTVYHIKGTVVESLAVDLTDVGNIAIVGDGIEASNLVVTGSNGLQFGCNSPLSNVFLSNLTVDNQDDDNATTALYIRSSDTLTNIIVNNVRVRGRGSRMIEILNNSGDIQKGVFKDIEIEFGVEPTTPTAGATGLYLTDWDGSELIIDGLTFRNLSLTGGSMAGSSYLVEFGSSTNILLRRLLAVGSILDNIGIFIVVANVFGSTPDMKVVDAEININVPTAHAAEVKLLTGCYLRNVDARLQRQTAGTVFQSWVCQDPQNYSDDCYFELRVRATGDITPTVQIYQALYIQAGQSAFLGDITALMIADIGNTFTLDASATENGAVYIADADVYIDKLVARCESIGLGVASGLEVVHNTLVNGSSNFLEISDLIAELRELNGGTLDAASVPVALKLSTGSGTMFVRRGILASNLGTTNAVLGYGGGSTINFSRPNATAIERRGIANAVSGATLTTTVNDGNV